MDDGVPYSGSQSLPDDEETQLPPAKPPKRKHAKLEFTPNSKHAEDLSSNWSGLCATLHNARTEEAERKRKQRKLQDSIERQTTILALVVLESSLKRLKTMKQEINEDPDDGESSQIFARVMDQIITLQGAAIAAVEEMI